MNKIIYKIRNSYFTWKILNKGSICNLDHCLCGAYLKIFKHKLRCSICGYDEIKAPDIYG